MVDHQLVYSGILDTDIRCAVLLVIKAKDNPCFDYSARYNPDKELWEAKSDKNPDFLAVTSGWLGLGSHQWTVYNDSKVRCGQGQDCAPP